MAYQLLLRNANILSCPSTAARLKRITNALADASSSYLRSAMHQPVEWLEGCGSLCPRRREDKPTLLDIGAVCHW